jgi:hypothetical protein
MSSGNEILHDPWPISDKKQARSAKGQRKGKRQSVFASEFEKLQQYGAEGANEPLTTDNLVESLDAIQGSAHNKRRRSSPGKLERVNSFLDPQSGVMENMAKRRQSLLPVLRAASMGEQVSIIEGTITSGENIGGHLDAPSSVSQTIQGFRRSSITAAENLMTKERLGSATQEEWLSSVANMKRRRTSSFVKEGVASEISQQLSKSGKLEDQINLQHLIELMRIFNVRPPDAEI